MRYLVKSDDIEVEVESVEELKRLILIHLDKIAKESQEKIWDNLDHSKREELYQIIKQGSFLDQKDDNPVKFSMGDIDPGYYTPIEKK